MHFWSCGSFTATAEQLHQFCRDANRVNEEWFTDEDSVRRTVGLLDEAPQPSTSGKVGDPVRDTALRPITYVCI